MANTFNDLMTFCKKKGFVFPTAEIYGGLQGFYDYGPMGVEFKNNLKNLFWKDFVKNKDFILGMDGSIITNPKVWVASEHVSKFVDVLSRCKKCGVSLRSDTLIEEQLGIDMEGKTPKEIQEVLMKNEVKCPNCGARLEASKDFHLMFETQIGPEQSEDTKGYLRPETAQLIFADFKTIFSTSRIKLPFGIAQIGKAFRNEISPRNFLFRLREFEQFEIEFFVNPNKKDDCPFYDSIKNKSINVSNTKHFVKKKIDSLLKKKVFASKWHAYWVYEYYNWFIKYGIKEEHLRIQPHSKDKLAHYAKACIDIEYLFSFGWKEIHGDADRGIFDLSQHEKTSKQKLKIFDETTNEKILPYVAAEPSQGIERALLAFLSEAFNFDKKRGNVVLKLHPLLAPIKLAVFPLVKKDGLNEKALDVYEKVKDLGAFLDSSGSIGRRYARQDEIGTPFCITIDYDTLKDNTVTLRNRDTTKQKRIRISEIQKEITKKISTIF